jgi:hypothetical protein
MPMVVSLVELHTKGVGKCGQGQSYNEEINVKQVKGFVVIKVS